MVSRSLSLTSIPTRPDLALTPPKLALPLVASISSYLLCATLAQQQPLHSSVSSFSTVRSAKPLRQLLDRAHITYRYRQIQLCLRLILHASDPILPRFRDNAIGRTNRHRQTLPVASNSLPSTLASTPQPIPHLPPSPYPHSSLG